MIRSHWAVATAVACLIAAHPAQAQRPEARDASAQAQPGGARPARPDRDPRIAKPSGTPGFTGLTEPRLPYHFVAHPQPPAGQKFGNVSAVALTPAGHLLVFNRNPAAMMVEYDAAGNVLRSFNPNIAVNTHGMRVDRHGNIWAIDSFLNVVWKLNPKGEPIMTIGARGENGPWNDQQWTGMLNQPLDVGWDADDNIYIVQSHGGTSAPPSCTYCATYDMKAPVTQGSDPRVLKFDKAGRFLASYALDSHTGEYNTIHTVVVTPKGEVWVGDRSRQTIMVFDRNLKLLRTIKQPVLVCGLFVDAKGELWMAAGMDGLIAKLDANGRITGWIGKQGRSTDLTDDLIGEAHYLAVSPDQKTIYIADSVNAKVLKLVHD